MCFDIYYVKPISNQVDKIDFEFENYDLTLQQLKGYAVNMIIFIIYICL